MKKLALNILKSADEKLRGLGGKQHGKTGHHPSNQISSPKEHQPTLSSTIRPVVIESEIEDRTVGSRTCIAPVRHSGNIPISPNTPPSEPPPDIPARPRRLPPDPPRVEEIHKKPRRLPPDPPPDSPPGVPSKPKPRLSAMAERRIQRMGRKEDAKEYADTARGGRRFKPRSKSEGPHGRKKNRNSMQEGIRESASKYSRQAFNARYSMYLEPQSDSDEERISDHAGTDSAESDDGTRKIWTKNPLLVKRIRKSDRNEKAENRKSLQSSENGVLYNQQNVANNRVSMEFPSHPKHRDLFIYQEKEINDGMSCGQRAKFQRLEELRKKRIDVTVTSDEECSPESRISRLRQRAMQSAKLFNNKGSADDINIIRANDMKVSSGSYDNFDLNVPRNSNGYMQYIEPAGSDMTGLQLNRRQVEAHIQPNASTEFRPGGNSYEQYARQQGISKFQPGFEMQSHIVKPVPFKTNVNQTSTPDEDGNVLQESTAGYSNAPTIPIQRHVQLAEKDGIQEQNQSRVSSKQYNLSSLDSQLQSFQNVRSNQPKVLKKGIERIKLNPGNSDTSEDSLDDLIESNIQYLESEIESGKLRRESGNYAKHYKWISETTQKSRSTESMPNRTGSVSLELKMTGTTSSPNMNERSINLEHQYLDKPDTQHIRTSQSAYYIPSRAVSQADKKMSKQIVQTFRSNIEQRTVESSEMEEVSKSDSRLDSQPQARIQLLSVMEGREHGTPFLLHPSSSQSERNVTQLNPNLIQRSESTTVRSLSLPVVDVGMFSDVEYDIEVSERVKKWEKKFQRKEENETELKTILENETVRESKITHDEDLKISDNKRSEGTAINSLSVTLTPTVTEVVSSQSETTSSKSPTVTYIAPKVVSTETNMHSIFKVVSQPGATAVTKTADDSLTYVKSQSSGLVQNDRQNLYRDEVEQMSRNRHALSMSDVTLEEEQIIYEPQDAPTAVDSDSGTRKSWRTSRYEEELKELKEMVSDNFKDIRKRFNSDRDKTDSRARTSSLHSIHSQDKVKSNASTEKFVFGFMPRVPRPKPDPISTSSNTSSRTPERRNALSATITPLSPKERLDQQTAVLEEQLLEFNNFIEGMEAKGKTSIADTDLRSPHLESEQGFVSMERIKAHTLQTIPFSEDPVWREIEEMTTFNKEQSEFLANIELDDIDSLLRIANGSEKVPESIQKQFQQQPLNVKVRTSSELFTSKPQVQVKLESFGSNSNRLTDATKYKTFPTTHIQPLRLQIKSTGSHLTTKSSASALDDVLEDIRISLQKKPMSPKVTSPQMIRNEKSGQIFFPRDQSSASRVQPSAGQGHYANVQPQSDSFALLREPKVRPANLVQQLDSSTFSAQTTKFDTLPYIDPDFTQFPYIINGNYHLDPSVLKEKLMGTGLVEDSSNQQSFNQTVHAKYLQGIATKPILMESVSNKSQSSASGFQWTPLGNVDNSRVSTEELDKSVRELKDLAREVEYKLTQIKSRIVSTDEEQLDTILYALRKFAPKTEQKYLDASQTPTETEQVKKQKLEDALSELEKIYKSLELDDQALMDKAEGRTGSVLKYATRPEEEFVLLPINYRSQVPFRAHEKSGVRKEQVAEVERQTQDEFEDITKSFQVLIDEVTKQYKFSTKGNSTQKVSSVASPVYMNPNKDRKNGQQRAESSLAMRSVVRRSEEKRDGRNIDTLYRDVQDDYNAAVKDLETLAKSSPDYLPSTQPPATEYVIQPTIQMQFNRLSRDPKTKRTVDKTVETKSTTANRHQRPVPVVWSPNTCKASTVVNSNLLSTAVSTKTFTRNYYSGYDNVSVDKKTGYDNVAMKNIPKNNGHGSAISETFQKKSDPCPRLSTKGTGRFRKRNAEHRKSMPAEIILKRTVETQTVETQTPSESQIKHESNIHICREGAPKTEQKKRKPVKGKVKKMVELFSSSDDERTRGSGLTRANSAPNLLALLNEKEENSRFVHTTSPNVEKTSTKSPKLKILTPRTIKLRSKQTSQSSQIISQDADLEGTASSPLTSEDGITSPNLNKPPVYPLKLQVIESPTSSRRSESKKSPRRPEKKSQNFTFEIASPKLASNEEDEKQKARERIITVLKGPMNRQQKSNSVERDEKRRSFPEVSVVFHSNTEQGNKAKQRLRKCASVDLTIGQRQSVLEKTYYSQSDLQDKETCAVLPRSGSGTLLKLEFAVKTKD